MSTIVYCLYEPEYDERGVLKPRPPNVLRWHATYPGEDEPVEFYVTPYLIATTDEQVALRTIAPIVRNVIGIQILKPDVRPFISRVVQYGDLMPTTWIVDGFTAIGSFTGLGRTHGLEISTRPADKVLLREQVKRLERYPMNKCYDQVQAARAKEAMRLRKNGVRGIAYVTGANKTPSCITLSLQTFRGIIQDKPDTPEFPLTDIEFLKIVKLSPKPRPKPLSEAPSRPTESYAELSAARLGEPPLEPEHPPANRAYAGDETPRRRMYWMDNDD